MVNRKHTHVFSPTDYSPNGHIADSYRGETTTVHGSCTAVSQYFLFLKYTRRNNFIVLISIIKREQNHDDYRITLCCITIATLLLQKKEMY